MPESRSTIPEQIYQLKVTLTDSRPPIWRRILVPSDVTLGKLHRILQAAMGWTDSHMHRFDVKGISFGIPDRELGFRSERTAKLNEIAPTEGFKFRYEYDFGDSWLHDIVVEKILPPDPDQRYPVCIKGKRAGPPEDCGGIWGYGDLVEVLKAPSHPDHDEMKEWLKDDEFDPEAFNLEQINQELRRVR